MAGEHPRVGSSALIDSLCLVFAGWTLLCHAVVFSHGSLRDLLWLAGAAALVFAGVVTALLRGPNPRGPGTGLMCLV
jgi:hypothetical protein